MLITLFENMQFIQKSMHMFDVLLWIVAFELNF